MRIEDTSNSNRAHLLAGGAFWKGVRAGAVRTVPLQGGEDLAERPDDPQGGDAN